MSLKLWPQLANGLAIRESFENGPSAARLDNGGSERIGNREPCTKSEGIIVVREAKRWWVG